jgi:hypothetical protein
VLVEPPLLHFPRFRALALFGRRSHELVVRTSMPASENLHISGCEQSQRRSRLFDHLIGAGEQRVRHGEPERPSGGEIDDQIELGRLLDRDVGRLRSA